MRCVACNKPLDDDELMIRGVQSGELLDMCVICIKHSGIETDFQDGEPIEPDVEGFWIEEDEDDIDIGC